MNNGNGLEEGKKEKINVYEELKRAEQERNIGKKLTKKGRSLVAAVIYYVTPIASLGVFIGIIVFGTIPAIKGIFNYMDQIKAGKKEVADLDSQIARLDDLAARESEFQSDLAIIDTIVPSTKTEVAKFVGQIADLATANNLEESAYESGEQRQNLEEIIEQQEQQKGDTAALIEIPSTSEYTAIFSNFGNFLNALYFKDDFIIVGVLDMQGYEAREFLATQQLEKGAQVTVDTSLPQNSWTMKVTFEKYQFSRGFAGYIEQNLVPLDAEPDITTLAFIRERYGGNSNISD